MSVLPRTGSHRYAGLQMLRVLACMAVLIFHITLDGRNTQTLSLPVWFGGMSGVDIFFVLSGFVMLQSADRLQGRANAWSAFLTNRLIRIVPMYWLFTVVFLLMGIGLSSTAIHRSYFPRWVIGSFLFWPTQRFPGDGVVSVCPVGWTLIFEMFFYLVVTAALALRRNVLWTATTVMVLVTLLGRHASITWGNVVFFLNSIVLEFVMGMLIYRLHARGHDLPRWLALPLLLMALGWMAATTPTLPRALVWGVPACAVVASVVALEGAFQRVPAFLLLLADATYVLYLLHFGVIETVLRFAFRSMHSPVALITACILGSVAGALAVHTMLEKPLQQWLMAHLASRRARRLQALAAAGGVEG